MTKIQRRGYTEHLNRHPAENICHGFDFAAWLGRPLNNYITINFDAASTDKSNDIFQAIRHKFRDWYNRRTKKLYGLALPPMYVYTHENPGGHTHCNWVVHVPAELQSEFDSKRSKWIARAHGNVRKYDVKAQAVDPVTAKSLAKYLIKGIDPRFAGYLHLQAYASPQGRIWGRRAGTSPALSRAARSASGFIAKQHRGTVCAANDPKAAA